MDSWKRQAYVALLAKCSDGQIDDMWHRAPSTANQNCKSIKTVQRHGVLVSSHLT